MKTAQEIRNEIAVKHGRKSWFDVHLDFELEILTFSQLENMEGEAMKAYAKQYMENAFNAAWNYGYNAEQKNYDPEIALKDYKQKHPLK